MLNDQQHDSTLKNSFGRIVVFAGSRWLAFEWGGDVSLGWFVKEHARRVLLVVMLPSVVGAFLYLHFVVELSTATWLRALSAVILGLVTAGLATLGFILLSLPLLALVYFAGKTRLVVTPTTWCLEHFIAEVRVRSPHGDTASVKLVSDRHTIRKKSGVIYNSNLRIHHHVRRRVLHRLVFRDAHGVDRHAFGMVLSLRERRFVRHAYETFVAGAAPEWPKNLKPWRAVTTPTWLRDSTARLTPQQMPRR